MRLIIIELLNTFGNIKSMTILSLFGDNQVTMTSIKKESVTFDFSTIYVFNKPFFTSLETKATFGTCYVTYLWNDILLILILSNRKYKI